MGQTVMQYKIHSLEDDNLLKPIFEKSYELYIETHRNYNNLPVNYFRKEEKIKNRFDVNLEVSYCPEIKGEQSSFLKNRISTFTI